MTNGSLADDALLSSIPIHVYVADLPFYLASNLLLTGFIQAELKHSDTLIQSSCPLLTGSSNIPSDGGRFSLCLTVLADAAGLMWSGSTIHPANLRSDRNTVAHGSS